MAGLTDEEMALLEAADDKPAAEPAKKTRARRKADEDETPAPAAEPITGSVLRGPITPVQWTDDDGWGGLPVQMRG